MESVTCPYCRKKAKLVTGKQIYPHRPDLKKLAFWQCLPCDAYVGCHKGSIHPLGRLANVDLRKAKIEAHNEFDNMWKSGHMTRSEAYKWLAETLGTTPNQTHIGEFDEAMCARVVEVCKAYWEGP